MSSANGACSAGKATRPSALTVTAATQSTTSTDYDHLTSPLLPPPITGLTRSEQLFAAGTGVNPRSLKIEQGQQFFLFMTMREEHQWTSQNMTSTKYVNATTDFNIRLEALCATASSLTKALPVKKNPRALMEKLAEIEPIIATRIQKRNYLCVYYRVLYPFSRLMLIFGNLTANKGTDTFWKQHCHAVPLVKSERGSEDETAGKHVSTRSLLQIDT